MYLSAGGHLKQLDKRNLEQHVTLNVQQFRDLMAGVCAPVTVVTTIQDGIPYGSTVSAFASLSLAPPMVTVALDRASNLLVRILGTKRFGINVLAKSQEETARVFATRGVDRFNQSRWGLDCGMPRLTAAASWLVCDLGQAVEGGDHMLLLGVV